MKRPLLVLLFILLFLEVKVERLPDGAGKSCTSDDAEDDWQAIMVIAKCSISPQK